MTRFLIIRHGSTDAMHRILCGRLPGFSLNELGRQEARTLGRKLGEVGDLQAVYASPMERAQQTAQEIAAHHELPVQTLELLNEIDFGSWTGKTFDELKESMDWAAFNRFRSTITPPGGESLAAVQARAWQAIMHLCALHTEGTVAVVSHGDVIRGLLLLLLGMPIDHIFRLEIGPCSLTTVSVAPGFAPVVHAINER